MNGTKYRCRACRVWIVEPDPPCTDLCPVCRTGGDPAAYQPVPDVRGDY